MTAMRCGAALSWRLPARVIRTRQAVLPDQTGIGQTPACIANLASWANRAAPAVSPTILAAVNAHLEQGWNRDLDQAGDPSGSNHRNSGDSP